MRAPRRDAVANRDALLDAAKSVLGADPDAGLDAIAAAAGLTRRAVYGHFESRDALVAEIAERGSRRVAAAAAALTDPDPIVDTALLGRVVWDDVADVRAMTQRVLRGPFADRIGPALGAIHERLVRNAIAAVADGRGRADLPPDAVARLIEGAAFTVLDESVRQRFGREEGRRLVVLAGLSALGLSWREADAVLATNAERLGVGGAA